GELPALSRSRGGRGGREPHVNQQSCPAVLQACCDRGCRLARHIVGELDWLAEQLAEPGSHPGPRPAGRGALGVTAAGGPAQVRADYSPRAPPRQVGDRRQAGPDPAVVGNAGAVERDVQVGPEQDAAGADVEVLDSPHDPAAIVSEESKVHEYGVPTMSEETTGSLV